LAENDRSYLKNIMERRLYQRSIAGLAELKEEGLKLKYY
jgi:hypothetical protein